MVALELQRDFLVFVVVVSLSTHVTPHNSDKSKQTENSTCVFG